MSCSSLRRDDSETNEFQGIRSGLIKLEITRGDVTKVGEYTGEKSGLVKLGEVSIW